MKVGKLGLKLSSGKIIHFKSKRKRENYEDVARAYKHKWKPKKQK